MESRVDKYYTGDCSTDTIPTRSSRNSRLYRQVYGKYDDLDNLPMDDNTDEIDMDKLKELVSNMEKKKDSVTPPNGYNLDILEKKRRNIDEQKVYDINKLLEKAKYENNKLKEPENKLVKTSRNILSTLGSTEISTDDIKRACEKYEDNKIDIYPNKDIDSLDNSLSMTREMKYQTRQISTDPLIEQVMPDNDLSLDLFFDLKPTGDTIVTKPIKDDNTNTSANNIKKESSVKDDSDIDVIKKDKNIDTDFFTSSYKFSDKDFTDDELFESSSSHNVLKVLLLILAILVFAGVIFYFVATYGMGVNG